MKPTIYIALTHDWELRGNGSGDIEQIQFGPMRRLLRIYASAGVRTTFLPDLMQQIMFRRLEEQNPELKELADRWDEHVLQAFQLGHDIQLHVHPQWRDAIYERGNWKLHSDWSLLNYDESSAYEMLFECKQYLERLLSAADPSYRSIAFRAGALAIAPSNHLLSVLVRLGIVMDVSLAAGFCFQTPDIQLDFRHCEESFLPFYPDLRDAREVSTSQEQIVCVPLHHFFGSRMKVFRSSLAIAQRKFLDRFSSIHRRPHDSAVGPNQGTKQRTAASTLTTIYQKGIAPVMYRKYLISDTARLTYPLLTELVTSIRESAQQTGLQKVPIVLTNHPKEMTDYTPIERFVNELIRSDDVKFITLTELARGIREGEFHVRQGSAENLH